MSYGKTTGSRDWIGVLAKSFAVIFFLALFFYPPDSHCVEGANGGKPKYHHEKSDKSDYIPQDKNSSTFSAGSPAPYGLNSVSDSQQQNTEGKNNYGRDFWDWLKKFLFEIKITDVLLALFTFYLWQSTEKLWEAGERQLAGLKRSIKIADDAGYATKVSAIVAQESIKLAREEFIATHRPKIRIRNIVIFDENELFKVGFPVGGQMYIANIGNSNSFIDEVKCKVYWTQKRLPMKRPYEGQDGDKSSPPVILIPGNSYPKVFNSDTVMGDMGPAIRRGITTNNFPPSMVGWDLYVMGWVDYRDGLENRRRTAFCRKYDPLTGRFRAIDDVDYEHEE